MFYTLDDSEEELLVTLCIYIPHACSPVDPLAFRNNQWGWDFGGMSGSRDVIEKMAFGFVLLRNILETQTIDAH